MMIPNTRLNHLIAKVINFTRNGDKFGIDRPNTVCQFHYYIDTDGTLYVVYLYKNVPVAFTRYDIMVDFASVVGETSNAYKRYLPMLKERAGQHVTVKYTVDRDFHISRKEFRS